MSRENAPIICPDAGPFLATSNQTDEGRAMEYQYLKYLHHIISHGDRREDRTGIGTLSTFGLQMRFPLQPYFPLFTTKRLHLKSIIYELLWFLRGDTNVRWLQQRGGRSGTSGPFRWRSWTRLRTPWRAGRRPTGEIDQLAGASSRCKAQLRPAAHMVVAWNPARSARWRCRHATPSSSSTSPTAALLSTLPTKWRHVPRRTVQHAATAVTLMAQVVELELGEFIHTLGDAHVLNHLE